ncbi:MarR family transcriptional regulator [Rhodovulum sp. BSW8]|uniref:MarR family winged helix-turn-helix transcriptional regulator n=1 Tax=Rhodovulum sp. BSW8 TaxID=2259645 RepID=UPI000DE4D78E|nr:MarR family transcriptional regulator [Rhodovulum sp. BSW8]RBO53312.1 MarR family transcriptional regulator [Rhodovulum sp. BSW8]
MQAVQKTFLPEVFRLVRGIRKRFNARATALDMTYARAQALVTIAGCEGLTQVELAERLDIRTPSMNRTLDALEAAGLVERRFSAEDKRVRCLYLTADARRQARDVTEFTDDLRREVYRGIDPDELDQALATIRKIQRNLDAMGAR